MLHNCQINFRMGITSFSERLLQLLWYDFIPKLNFAMPSLPLQVFLHNFLMLQTNMCLLQYIQKCENTKSSNIPLFPFSFEYIEQQFINVPAVPYIFCILVLNCNNCIQNMVRPSFICQLFSNIYSYVCFLCTKGYLDKSPKRDPNFHKLQIIFHSDVEFIH